MNYDLIINLIDSYQNYESLKHANVAKMGVAIGITLF